MRVSVLCILLFVSLVAPGAGGAPTSPPDAAQHGLSVACAKSPTGGPCKFSVGDTTVGAGQTRSWSDGNYTFTGSVHIMAGGSVESHNATLTFASGATGFLVDANGSLSIHDDALRSAACDCAATYGLDLLPGSTLALTRSTLTQGRGLHLATDDAEVSTTTFASMARGVFLDHVAVTLHDNAFVGDSVGINATGGQPVMDHNTFLDTHDCIRDYQTDPTITNNAMHHCIIGIWHEESHSYIALNSLDEDEDPSSIGIAVVNGNSPIIEGNDITDFATGILVDHARAYLRNNTIHGNTGDGIRVSYNTMPMDIQGNVLDGNGGDGIHLDHATDVTLARNHVVSAAFEGIVFDASSNVTSDHDVVEHADFGFYVLHSSGVHISHGLATSDRVGVLVDGGDANSIFATNASDNLLDGFNLESGAGTTTLDQGIALHNGRAGAYLVSGTNTATHGWYEGNALAGVTNNAGNPTADATCSYWGSATGPHADDNAGSGDNVFGDVQYRPFATTPGGSCVTVLPTDFVG